jgi:type II secretory pathway pseudopilin PulG
MKLLKNSFAVQWGRGAQAAFTMVEIALSLAVIGFALVAIIGILPTGMSVQKDNRQDTLISMDATYLMESIVSGTRGPDQLTNHIVCITNYFYDYDDKTNLVASSRNWFTTTNYQLGAGPVYASSYLTNSSNIIGVISIPRYPTVNPNGSFTSNFTTADFRAMSSPLVDQGTNTASRDFAFTYRLYPQLIQWDQHELEWTNYTEANITPEEATNRLFALKQAMTLRDNLKQMRLRFEWPVLPSGDTGNGRQVFRTFASGALINIPDSVTARWFIQPQVYTNKFSL